MSLGEREREKSSSLTDGSLRRATGEDVPRLKATLAEAFFDDPVLSWLSPTTASGWRACTATSGSSCATSR